jgi:DNA-binding MarR family transcriptional regulator
MHDRILAEWVGCDYIDINLISLTQAETWAMSLPFIRPTAEHRLSDHSKPTFDTAQRIRDRCLCLHAQRAARALARHFDNALRPVGLSNGQFSLLVSLNRPAPAAMGSLSELLAMDRTTLTANLKPLERRRLLKIAVDPDDRRSRRVSLTPAGKALLRKAVPLWQQAHAETERLVGMDPGGLRAALRALTDATARQ